jgi:hypothetical protein
MPPVCPQMAGVSRGVRQTLTVLFVPPQLEAELGAWERPRALILNWYRANGEISRGAVEGLNNKIRVVTRRSHGFRTYKATLP